MPAYDPRRSRPTPKVAPDEESAPIDALLGPDPDPAPTAAESPAVSNGSSATAPSAQPSSPAPVRRAQRAPSALLQMSPAIVAALVVLLVWWLRRLRRSR
ncbi:MAG: hypothetical protein JJE52_13945 [Acidimicrobiia bacterium]|nr:hypothetical protein [Acidimicrobiia bacterium]